MLGFPFSLVGCGGNHGTIPVSITITHKGSPLSEASVMLVSTDGKGHSAAGRTDSSGVAIVETTQGWKGALPGEYAIAVRKWERVEVPAPSEEDPNGKGVIQKSILPEKYAEPSTSGFTLTVGNKATQVAFDIAE
jgi:hypothetical protein